LLRLRNQLEGLFMQRENRYLVLKRKDIEKYLTDEAKEELENIVIALSIAKQPDIDTGAKSEVECVVVEKDWPMYESTWREIEAWVDSCENCHGTGFVDVGVGRSPCGCGA